jgi:hypothetical protein
MKKIVLMIAALLMLSTADADAQGFLKKLKQKAQAVVGNASGDEESEDADDADRAESGDVDPSQIAVAQGSDIVPKRKTSTVTWDGVITPSKASTASALMQELPALPSAEKMARSTMEEREAYAQKIAAVVARAEQLQADAKDCSDAEMEAERAKWENKVQNLFGLTKEEMAILQDENAPESKKQPIQDKVMANIMGGDVDQVEIQRFEKMSEKEQEAYIKAHPEFTQKMMKMAQNAGNFSKKMKQMTAALNGYEVKLGRLVNNYLKAMNQERKHDYSAIAKKYNDKLQKLYDQICATDDASQIDALYQQADKLLYDYRLEAAKEYRASLQRQIAEAKKFAAEYAKITQEVVDSGDLPACAVGRMDLNAVISVADLLDAAYKELPELEAKPVCTEIVYELPKGWGFVNWECRGYAGKVEEMKTPGEAFPLLVKKDNEQGEPDYGVVENGKFRQISQSELQKINQQADARVKNQSKSSVKPPYGVYKSRSGVRSVEYSKTGELIINGMTSLSPVAFSAYSDRLEWIVLDDAKIVKCTYKL